jgi:drug/metabolite transporter (DMT)-like permease
MSRPFPDWLRRGVLVVLITFAASLTPVVIRVAQGQGIPSLAILLIRMVLSTLVMTPYVLRRHAEAVTRLTRTDWLWAALAGFWLALNLLALFFALEYTSVLVTGIFRRTTPIWVIVPEILLLGAAFSWRTWTGSVLSVVGVMVVTVGTGGAVNAGSRPLLGALIALGGSVCFGVYLLIGRKLSGRLPSLVYSWLVFLFAAMVVGGVTAFTRTPLLGYTRTAYLWVVIVTFLSQYVGHVSINIGLKTFSATAMSILLELSVVLGAVIAFFQFNEIPSALQVVGAAVIIVGVVLASTENKSASPTSVKPPR